MSTALFEQLHPRVGNGTFTERLQSEGTAILSDPACAMAVDLEWVAEIRKDLQAALAPRSTGAAHVRAQWTPEVKDAVRIREEKRKAAEEALDIYGGTDLAVAAIGSAVADRAEILAGITVTEIRSGWGQRLEEAETEYETAEANWKAGGPDGYARYGSAMQALGRIKDGTDDDTKRDLRKLADGYLESLREIRPMGGTLKLHPKSDKRASRVLQEAAQMFPTDFIEASNVGALPLLAKDVAGRAHYTHGEVLKHKEAVHSFVTRTRLPGEPVPVNGVDREWELIEDEGEGALISGMERYRSRNFEVKGPKDKWTPSSDGSPRGTGWEKWVDPRSQAVSWRRQRTYNKTAKREQVGKLQVDSDSSSYMEGRSGSLSTALHEFTHRSEAVVHSGRMVNSAPAVGVAELEAEFFERRTTFEDENGRMVQQHKEQIRPDSKTMSKEYCRPDHFPSRYMGKEYGGTYFEVMTQGMEAVFAGQFGGLVGIGRYSSDRESRDFVLGTLAVAHAPAHGAQV